MTTPSTTTSPLATDCTLATPSRLGVHARLVGMAALWGASWPCGRVLAQALPPLSAACWRYAIATLVLALWLRAARPGALRALSRRQWLGLAFAGALGVWGYATFFMLGLRHVPAGRAALVVAANPVLTTLVAAWWFRERLNARIGLGMAAAAAGSVTVLSHGAPWRLFSGSAGVGEALLCGCVVTWVGYTLAARRLLAGVDVLTTTAVTAGAGTLGLLASALVVEGPAALAGPLAAHAPAWVALLFLAIGSTVVSNAWYFRGVAALGAGGASAYISLVPVFGVLVATAWLGEPVDASLVVGGLLAVAGMALMNAARR
ncbi:MAG: DMT family transporter [Burkholderiaceae bacterium]